MAKPENGNSSKQKINPRDPALFKVGDIVTWKGERVESEDSAGPFQVTRTKWFAARYDPKRKTYVDVLFLQIFDLKLRKKLDGWSSQTLFRKTTYTK